MQSRSQKQVLRFAKDDKRAWGECRRAWDTKKIRWRSHPPLGDGAARDGPPLKTVRKHTAENHHLGGTGPPEPHELPRVQAALPPLNLLKTMQIKGIAAGRSTLAPCLHSFRRTLMS